jgi:hypothetical protein
MHFLKWVDQTEDFQAWLRAIVGNPGASLSESDRRYKLRLRPPSAAVDDLVFISDCFVDLARSMQPDKNISGGGRPWSVCLVLENLTQHHQTRVKTGTAKPSLHNNAASAVVWFDAFDPRMTILESTVSFASLVRDVPYNVSLVDWILEKDFVARVQTCINEDFRTDGVSSKHLGMLSLQPPSLASRGLVLRANCVLDVAEPEQEHDLPTMPVCLVMAMEHIHICAFADVGSPAPAQDAAVVVAGDPVGEVMWADVSSCRVGTEVIQL